MVILSTRDFAKLLTARLSWFSVFEEIKRVNSFVYFVGSDAISGSVSHMAEILFEIMAPVSMDTVFPVLVTL